jgi:hypothetical protein
MVRYLRRPVLAHLLAVLLFQSLIFSDDSKCGYYHPVIDTNIKIHLTQWIRFLYTS